MEKAMQNLLSTLLQAPFFFHSPWEPEKENPENSSKYFQKICLVGIMKDPITASENDTSVRKCIYI